MVSVFTKSGTKIYESPNNLVVVQHVYKSGKDVKQLGLYELVNAETMQIERTFSGELIIVSDNEIKIQFDRTSMKAGQNESEV